MSVLRALSALERAQPQGEPRCADCDPSFDCFADYSKRCELKAIARVEKHTGDLKDMAIIVWLGEQPAEGTLLYAALSTRAQPQGEAFNLAMAETWKMVDPIRPSGQPGSYARGEHNGIIAALQTLRENFTRIYAAPPPAAQPAVPEGAQPFPWRVAFNGVNAYVVDASGRTVGWTTVERAFAALAAAPGGEGG